MKMLIFLSGLPILDKLVYNNPKQQFKENIS